jgi:hypothetical protein
MGARAQRAPIRMYSSQHFSKKLRLARNFFAEQIPYQGDRKMNQQFREYRFARIEAENITRARLEVQFKDGISAPEGLEKAIEQLLAPETTCTPWRKSELEQAGSRDGTRMAALEFYWTHRRRLLPAVESQ